MWDRLIFVLILFATLGAGLMAGFFFTFSNTVMQALARQPQPAGMKAMQAINVTVLNPLFFAVFFGTALLAAVLAVLALIDWIPAQSLFLLVAGLAYVAGTLAVTLVFNVPMNEALAKADPASAAGADLWRDYLSRWVFWNHVRSIASLVSLAGFALALVGRG